MSTSTRASLYATVAVVCVRIGSGFKDTTAVASSVGAWYCDVTTAVSSSTGVGGVFETNLSVDIIGTSLAISSSNIGDGSR